MLSNEGNDAEGTSTIAFQRLYLSLQQTVNRYGRVPSLRQNGTRDNGAAGWPVSAAIWQRYGRVQHRQPKSRGGNMPELLNRDEIEEARQASILNL